MSIEVAKKGLIVPAHINERMQKDDAKAMSEDFVNIMKEHKVSKKNVIKILELVNRMDVEEVKRLNGVMKKEGIK